MELDGIYFQIGYSKPPYTLEKFLKLEDKDILDLNLMSTSDLSNWSNRRFNDFLDEFECRGNHEILDRTVPLIILPQNNLLDAVEYLGLKPGGTLVKVGIIGESNFGVSYCQVCLGIDKTNEPYFQGKNCLILSERICHARICHFKTSKICGVYTDYCITSALGTSEEKMMKRWRPRVDYKFPGLRKLLSKQSLDGLDRQLYTFSHKPEPGSRKLKDHSFNMLKNTNSESCFFTYKYIQAKHIHHTVLCRHDINFNEELQESRVRREGKMKSHNVLGAVFVVN